MSRSAATRAAATTSLIEARKVTRILPGIVPTTLVQDIDLAVRENEFVAITGPSGSGKSSLLYLLGLLDLPTRRGADPRPRHRAYGRGGARSRGSRGSASCSSSISCCRNSRRSTT